LQAKYNTDMINISADNAALSVTRDVSTLYETKYPEAPRITTTGDPSHCLDLPCKDSAKVQVLADLLEVAKAIVKLCKTDRVDAKEEQGEGSLPQFEKAKTFAETRFYQAKGARTQKPFLDKAREMPTFLRFYEPCKSERQSKIDELLDSLTPLLYQQLELATKWFGVFEHAVHMTSSNSFPMSCYPQRAQHSDHYRAFEQNGRGHHPGPRRCARIG
jgi:hypothetical protein